MNVPKLRFKEFDNEVEKYKIREVFNVQTGLTPLRSNLDYFTPKYISWIKTLDLNDSLIYETDEHVSELALSETSLKIIPPNTVLIAMYGGFNQIGRTGLTTMEATTNQAISALIPNGNMQIHPYFIQNYLNAHKDYWKSIAASSRKDPNITKRDIEKFSISIPEFLEQQKMGHFFKLLNKRIQLQQQKIDLLQEQKKGYMQKLFPKAGETQPEMRFDGFTGDWEERKLKEVGKIFTGNTPSTTDKSNYAEQGILWVTPTDIKHLITTETSKKLSIKGEKIARIVPSGTILVTCIASIGKNTMVLDKSGFNQQINSLTPNSNNDSYFLLTQSEFWSRKMKNIAASGTMRIVNKNEFSNLIFSYPTLEEQQKIGAFFKKLDENIVLQQKKLNIYKKQRQGFMQQMFI